MKKTMLFIGLAALIGVIMGCQPEPEATTTTLYQGEYPTVFDAAPTNGQIVFADSSLLVNGHFYLAGLKMKGVYISVNNSSYGKMFIYVFSSNWSTNLSFLQGTNHYSVYLQTSDGIFSATNYVSNIIAIIDTSMPQLTVNQPTNNQTNYLVSGGLRISGTCSDAESGINRIYYSFDGNPFSSTLANSSWNFITKLTPGVHSNGMIYCSDKAGNLSLTNHIPNFYVENLVQTSGRFRIIDGVYSPQLDNFRTVVIYLPASYDDGNSNFYKVLYMQDGENLWLGGGTYGNWHVDTAYDDLVNRGLIEEVILVAISTSDNGSSEIRGTEYNATYDNSRGYGGLLTNYIAFMTNQVMGLVNGKFRALTGPENTAIMGSSFGGNASFYAAWEHPEVFGMSACLSAAIWWDEQSYMRLVMNNTSPKKPIKFYFDAGNSEDYMGNLQARSIDYGYTSAQTPIYRQLNNGAVFYAEDNFQMAHLLIDNGWTNNFDVMIDIDYDGEHSESFWSERVYKPLTFFFAKTNNWNATNIVPTLSSTTLDKAQTIQNSMLWVKAYYDNGVDAIVPIPELTITSPQSNLFTVLSNSIFLNPANVTAATAIELTIEYEGLTTNCTINVTL